MEADNIEEIVNNIPQSMFAKFITYMSEYEIPDLQAFQLGTDYDENSLNDIIKGILQQTIDQQTLDKVKFDFLVEGKLLRGKIKSHIVRYELSTETTLKIQYFIAFQEMNKTQQSPQQDWISSICDVIGPQQNLGISVGMFNGSAAFHQKYTKKMQKNRQKIHDQAIKAIKSIPSSVQNKYYLISGGLGQELKISTFSGSQKIQKISQNQHEGTILGIDINPSLDGHFCSVGNSGTVKVWKIPETFLEDDHNEVKIKQKKKKLNKKIVPLVGQSKIHNDEINSVCWLNSSQIITGSSDHSMKIIDVERMSEIKTIKTKDSITTCIDFSYDNLITSHEDGYIRMWDVRDPHNPTSTFKSHAKFASCAKFSKYPNIFASGAYDQTVKIWDNRSVFPLQTMNTDYDKVFCLSWKNSKQLISGGSSNKLTFHSV